MEAFFPLIVTAIIYFIIANIMIQALTQFEISIDPKRRKRRLKGIKVMQSNQEKQSLNKPSIDEKQKEQPSSENGEA